VIDEVGTSVIDWLESTANLADVPSTTAAWTIPLLPAVAIGVGIGVVDDDGADVVHAV
jgi:hypothetical protein